MIARFAITGWDGKQAQEWNGDGNGGEVGVVASWVAA